MFGVCLAVSRGTDLATRPGGGRDPVPGWFSFSGGLSNFRAPYCSATSAYTRNTYTYADPKRGRNRTREGSMIRIPRHRFNRASAVQLGSTRRVILFVEYFQSLPKCRLLLGCWAFLVEYSRTTETQCTRRSKYSPSIEPSWMMEPSSPDLDDAE